MKKVIKILIKTFRAIVVAVAALLFACWILLQTPAVQTFAARKVVDSLGETLNGRIEFSKIHFRPISALVLKDVVLLDNEPVTGWNGERLDTIASARSIVATLSLKGSGDDVWLHIKRLSVSDGSFTLAKDERGGSIGRFVKKKNNKKESEPLPLRFDADRVRVKNFRFRMVNKTNPSPLKEYGIDWKNLDVTVRELKVNGLEYGDGRVYGSVERLSAIERSGYDILEMSGKTTVEKGRIKIRGISCTFFTR